MNPMLNGLFLGRAIAEGDTLGALPFVKDIVAAIKAAAPNLIRSAASTQLTKLQQKLQPAAYDGVSLPVVVPATSAPVESRPDYSRWIVPAVVTVGGVALILYMRRRR